MSMRNLPMVTRCCSVARPGLPGDVLETIPASQRLRLPMRPDSRSLNLSNTVAVAVYEAWRQLGFAGA